jgi:RNA polymerase primary sigma factor
MKSIKITQKITERNCQSIDKYFKEVSDISLISKLDEERLFERIKSGDMQARNELISANLRFVISISKQYLGRGLSLEDLISEGNIGLVKACDKFQPERGLKFITYAVWWIRQSILEALSQTGRDIRLPHNVNNLLNQIRSCEDKLTVQLSRTPHLSEVADEMGIDISKLESIVVLKSGSKSLDVSLSDDGDFSLIDTLQSEDEFDMGFDLDHNKQQIASLFFKLNDKERFVITRLFGLGVEAASTTEVANELNLSGERVRQIKNSALKKMRG